VLVRSGFENFIFTVVRREGYRHVTKNRSIVVIFSIKLTPRTPDRNLYNRTAVRGRSVYNRAAMWDRNLYNRAAVRGRSVYNRVAMWDRSVYNTAAMWSRSVNNTAAVWGRSVYNTAAVSGRSVYNTPAVWGRSVYNTTAVSGRNDKMGAKNLGHVTIDDIPYLPGICRGTCHQRVPESMEWHE